MTTIILLSLFILQVITFYFLALLYTKSSKYDDLEKKQQTMMREMDDSIGLYLSELKDENDRLIEKLSKKVDKEEVPLSPVPIVEKSSVNNIPVNLALKSYQAINNYKNQPKQLEEPDERTRTIQLHEAGQTVEEIAKKLGKGRTEIELILKFR